MKVVEKVWGREIWLVNEPEYCCKLLKLNKGASGSLHYHRLKKETFIIRKGKVTVELDALHLILDEGDPPYTILPGQVHRMTGLEDSIILEVSTYHDDDDVVRLEASKA